MRPHERMPLEPSHRGLIARQTSMTLASNGTRGWPYLQHRGGPPGFIHVLDEETIAFADYEGNEQYVSTGNIDADPRVAILFLEASSRTRLKVFGRATVIEGADDPDLLERMLETPSGRTKSPARRVIVVAIDSWDANCRKYIRPAYDRDAVAAMIAPYRDDLLASKQRITELEAKISDLEARLAH